MVILWLPPTKTNFSHFPKAVSHKYNILIKHEKTFELTSWPLSHFTAFFHKTLLLKAEERRGELRTSENSHTTLWYRTAVQVFCPHAHEEPTPHPSDTNHWGLSFSLDALQAHAQQERWSLQSSYILIHFEAGEPRDTARMFYIFRYFCFLGVYRMVKVLSRTSQSNGNDCNTPIDLARLWFMSYS